MLTHVADKITWLGHSSFRIDAEKVIYIDPYQLSKGPMADLVLITHSHHDHLSPKDLDKIKNPDTVFVTEKSSVKPLTGDVQIMAAGDSITACGIKIEAVHAYNLNKKFHPRKNGWLGFILEIDGIRIYHAGDTDYIPEMKKIDADIALLPVSGTYVMTAEEAVKAAMDISPGLAIPMHYGTLVGEVNDAEIFQNQLAGRIDVKILNKEE